MGELWILRHGETAWSKAGRHTGLTDIPLTADGERGAAAWAPYLGRKRFAAVLSSPRTRARRTAELAGVDVTEVTEELREWEYGDAEGRTTKELQAERPGWDVWTTPFAGGETLDQVAARVDALIARLAAGPLTDGDVLLVAHGHVLRILTARWAEQPPIFGQRVLLDPAGLGVLGSEHGRRAIHRLGVRPDVIT